MVKHVSQFPSDTELQRFISTVADKVCWALIGMTEGVPLTNAGGGEGL